jgi:hypothetical protein
MARRITNSGEIEEYCRGKQELEQKLAKRLYLFFNQGKAVDKLRRLAKEMLTDVVNSMSQGTSPMDQVAAAGKVMQALTAERFLDVWKTRTSGEVWNWNRPRQILQKVDQFSASDCSDVIRFCGAWNEERGGNVMDVQGAYRGGVLPNSAQKSGAGWAAEYAQQQNKAVWGKARERNKPEIVFSDIRKKFFVEAHIKPLKGPSSMGGMQLKRACGNSTVLKIDRMFGLLTGADISGTTADSTSLMERYGAEFLHPVFYLVPAATIVYNFHHTLLEVALVLSLNGVADYRIGFYETLLPISGNGVQCFIPEDYREVENALKDAQKDTRHFLVYYDETSKQKAGCILFESPLEIFLLQKSDLSRATQVLAHSQLLSSHPTRGEVEGLVKKLAPVLSMRLPS